MTSKKAFAIFIFLFVIPYLCGLAIIGVAYNAMVLHSTSLWRSAVGALVGATLLYFAKIPLERPLRILGRYTYRFIHLTVRFFMLDNARPLKRVLNYLIDFGLAFFATYALRWLFPGQAGKSIIMSTMNGWLVAALFISLCIGAYMDFDVLSIAPRQDLDAKND
ncbi:hypothetical protein PQ472_04500 [Lacticaseibacillus pabuli]|uniref:Uncharacterized protein n=1 Tax=Lacticaseibacillus pabuli TaxID=3025672 RepID=A0ABY7WTM6_9LACO|nr:hypothetical protein [Lacticaseibacillus sp. KACC 23028]WDF83502.1 hypothetical protein PQ472_04500 [Lacticaseibacillus sp. KACC 23028]